MCKSHTEWRDVAKTLLHASVRPNGFKIFEIGTKFSHEGDNMIEMFFLVNYTRPNHFRLNATLFSEKQHMPVHRNSDVISSNIERHIDS